jgi:SAM-dependent methyltransferase
MSGEFSPDWLALREPADAAARDTGLADELRDRLIPPLTVLDLGCGTGSMGRWLAPRLRGPQHWVLTDRDPALLAHARTHLPGAVTVETRQGDITALTVQTRQGDVTALTADDLAGIDLVTCSALLDLLTAGEVGDLVALCAAGRTAALFTLSVTGTTELDPADPLDKDIAAAFNEHQRRVTGGRRLLGPDAAEVAAAALAGAGATVIVRDTPWRLGSDHAALASQWLAGWAGAAAEQRPELPIGDYLRRRRSEPFSAEVGHKDVLAIF